MKFGVLQFFSWSQRRVPLWIVYKRALQRITIMDKTGYDTVWLAENHRQPLAGEILGTAGGDEPQPPVAAPGQAVRSPAAGRSLRLVHRGLGDRQPVQSQNTARSLGLGLSPGSRRSRLLPARVLSCLLEEPCNCTPMESSVGFFPFLIQASCTGGSSWRMLSPRQTMQHRLLLYP